MLEAQRGPGGAAELVGLWKIQSANERLAKRIRESDYPSEQLIAARALARLGQLDRLQELSALGQAQPVRIAAIAAWAEVAGYPVSTNPAVRTSS